MSRYKLGDLTIKNWNDWDRVVRDPVTVGVMITQGIGYSAAAAGWLLELLLQVWVRRLSVT